MKKGLSIGMIAIVIVVMQACSSYKMGSTRDSATVKSPETQLAERRATLEVERAATAERRRLEFDERYKATPFYTNAAGNVVYNKSEVDPTYNGGEEALTEYLRDQLVYPADARAQGVEGTIFVDFVVLANGTINEVYVMEAPGEVINRSLREEAVRVIEDMPNWIPGRQNGEAVDVRYSLPITFRIG